MKKIFNPIFIAILFFSFSACEKIAMKPNPATDPKSIFTEYTTLVKEKYAMLEFKGVDIQHLHDSIIATIDDNISEDELFDKLAYVTMQLRDGHSDLSFGEKYAGYDFITGYPPAIEAESFFAYLGRTTNPFLYVLLDDEELILKDIPQGENAFKDKTLKAIYGTLQQDTDIGYLWIPSWKVEMTEEQIEKIFYTLNETKGLIFDMRQNTGGDPALATTFASYLTNEHIYTGYERFKTGPGENDFSDSKVYLEPTSSENRYDKPVVVLTDRFCYSASTTFAYSVNPLEQVTFIGQRTGGGSGSVGDGFLANGWHWSLSVSEFIDHLGNHLDNGFEPDIPVALDTLVTDVDELIQRGILELQ